MIGRCCGVRDACSGRLSGCCPNPHCFCSGLSPQALWGYPLSYVSVLGYSANFRYHLTLDTYHTPPEERRVLPRHVSVCCAICGWLARRCCGGSSGHRFLNKVGFGELKSQKRKQSQGSQSCDRPTR